MPLNKGVTLKTGNRTPSTIQYDDSNKSYSLNMGGIESSTGIQVHSLVLANGYEVTSGKILNTVVAALDFTEANLATTQVINLLGSIASKTYEINFDRSDSYGNKLVSGVVSFTGYKSYLNAFTGFGYTDSITTRISHPTIPTQTSAIEEKSRVIFDGWYTTINFVRHAHVIANTFNKGVLVYSGDATYLSLQDVPANTALTDTSYWGSVGTTPEQWLLVAPKLTSNITLTDTVTLVDTLANLMTALPHDSVTRSEWFDVTRTAEVAEYALVNQQYSVLIQTIESLRDRLSLRHG